MIDIENNLKNYNSYLVHLFKTSIKNRKKIYDFGAGIGTLSEIYMLKTGHAPTCIELDSSLYPRIKSRGLHVIPALDYVTEGIEAIFISNVMEHIQNDQEIFNQMYKKLGAGGKLIVFVPAFMCLFSDLDNLAGHYRRYKKSELFEKITNAGFYINKINYEDSIGFFAYLYLAIKRQLRSSNMVAMPVSQRAMKFYDKFLFPLSRTLDLIGLRFILGKNFFVEATKK